MRWILWLELILDLILLTAVARYFKQLRTKAAPAGRVWTIWAVWFVTICMLGYTIWRLFQS